MAGVSCSPELLGSTIFWNLWPRENMGRERGPSRAQLSLQPGRMLDGDGERRAQQPAGVSAYSAKFSEGQRARGYKGRRWEDSLTRREYRQRVAQSEETAGDQIVCGGLS
jgi:hypothetical protein